MTSARDIALGAAQEARGHGEWRRTHCPFCEARTGKADKRASWGFNTRTGRHHCWKCGEWGYIDLTLLGIAAPEEVPADDVPVVEPGKPESFLRLCEEPALGALLFREAREYLLGRGVTEPIWAAAEIGVCTDGVGANRVIVPVIDRLGRWRGWVGRAWSAFAPLRYRYPKGMKRGELLWNENALTVDTEEPLFVVEGVFDGLAHWPNAVACLGKPTDNQLQLLLGARRPIVVALDGDAWMEGRATAMKLRLRGAHASAVRLPPCTDPGVMSRSALKELAHAGL